MARIIQPGYEPEPPTPWYLTQTLTCPRCQAKFALEEGDFMAKAMAPIDPNAPLEWSVVATQRTLNGEQVIGGPCPFCHEPIQVTGRMGGWDVGHKAIKEHEAMILRASLPRDADGIIWVRGIRDERVKAVPTWQGGPITAQHGETRIHVIGRHDGQMHTDLTAQWDGFWDRYARIEEAQAAKWDMELVDFVQRLGIVKTNRNPNALKKQVIFDSSNRA